MMAMQRPESRLVVVIDDDVSVRVALRSLLRSLGLRVESFASAEAFLLRRRTGKPACLIVDVGMPGMSGFDLQRVLEAAGRALPTVFISAQHDSAAMQTAERAGAIAFLRKPLVERTLIAALRSTLDLDGRVSAVRAARNPGSSG